MQRNKAKKALKLAMLIYVASFLIMNWNDVSWVFNYKGVSGLLDDFFNPYKSIYGSSMDSYFYPNHSQSAEVVVTDVKTVYTDKQNVLEIPKINISVPIVFSTSLEKNPLIRDLDTGVVFYPGSVYPGQSGQMVILGHSAPPGWPKIKYDWVFSELDKLVEGDIVLIHLNNKQYTYTVKKKSIIKKGADVSMEDSKPETNILTLISCWPPGKDYQRIAVHAEL